MASQPGLRAGQRLPDDLVYMVAQHLCVQDAMRVARASRSLMHAVSPVAIRADLAAAGHSVYAAVRTNNFDLLDKAMRSPAFDINRLYAHQPHSLILAYAVHHATLDMFRVLTATAIYQDTGHCMPDLGSSARWLNRQGGSTTLFSEAVKYGRSDLVPYISDVLHAGNLLAGWPRWTDARGPGAYWKIDAAHLRRGMPVGFAIADPALIHMLSASGMLPAPPATNNMTSVELVAVVPTAPYHILRRGSQPHPPRTWTCNPLHAAVLQRQHPDARPHITIAVLQAWLASGIDVNAADGGLTNRHHAVPWTTYHRRALDYAAEALDLDAMAFLLRQGATPAAPALLIDNSSATTAARLTRVTTSTLLLGHRLFPAIHRLSPAFARPWALPDGHTAADQRAVIRLLWTNIKLGAPGVLAQLPRIEDQICTAIRLLLQHQQQQHPPSAPCPLEPSSNLPIDIYAFLHDEFLESPALADLLLSTTSTTASWINTRDWQGRTPLSQLLSRVAPASEQRTWRPSADDAAWYLRRTFRKPRLARWLLEHGGDAAASNSTINARDAEGVSPLGWALFWVDDAMVRLLLRHGARPAANDLALAQLVLRANYAGGLDAFTNMAFRTLFAGAREGFVRRLRALQAEWAARPAGIRAWEERRPAGGPVRRLVRLSAGVRDSGLGNFVGVHVSLGERLTSSAAADVVPEIVDERRRVFCERMERLRAVLGHYLG